MKTVTLEQLKNRGACHSHKTLFKRTFGEVLVLKSEAHSVEIAETNAFDYTWAAKHLLRAEPRKTYIAAMAEPRNTYSAAMAEPLKTYIAARAKAYEAYDAAMAEPCKIYIASRAKARKTYAAARAKAGKAYDAAAAENFARLYYNQQD